MDPYARSAAPPRDPRPWAMQRRSSSSARDDAEGDSERGADATLVLQMMFRARQAFACAMALPVTPEPELRTGSPALLWRQVVQRTPGSWAAPSWADEYLKLDGDDLEASLRVERSLTIVTRALVALANGLARHANKGDVATAYLGFEPFMDSSGTLVLQATGVETPDAGVAPAMFVDMLTSYLSRIVDPPLPTALWTDEPQVACAPIVRPSAKVAGAFVSSGRAVLKITVRRPGDVVGADGRPCPATYTVRPRGLGYGLLFIRTLEGITEERVSGQQSHPPPQQQLQQQVQHTGAPGPSLPAHGTAGAPAVAEAAAGGVDARAVPLGLVDEDGRRVRVEALVDMRTADGDDLLAAAAGGRRGGGVRALAVTRATAHAALCAPIVADLPPHCRVPSIMLRRAAAATGPDAAAADMMLRGIASRAQLVELASTNGEDVIAVLSTGPGTVGDSGTLPLRATKVPPMLAARFRSAVSLLNRQRLLLLVSLEGVLTTSPGSRDLRPGARPFLIGLKSRFDVLVCATAADRPAAVAKQLGLAAKQVVPGVRRGQSLDLSMLTGEAPSALVVGVDHRDGIGSWSAESLPSLVAVDTDEPRFLESLQESLIRVHKRFFVQAYDRATEYLSMLSTEWRSADGGAAPAPKRARREAQQPLSVRRVVAVCGLVTADTLVSSGAGGTEQAGAALDADTAAAFDALPLHFEDVGNSDFLAFGGAGPGDTIFGSLPPPVADGSSGSSSAAATNDAVFDALAIFGAAAAEGSAARLDRSSSTPPPQGDGW